MTVAHSTVTLVPASEKEEEEEEEGGNNKNEMFEFVPEALNDILSLPPKRVFTLYGTHVVTGLIYGGELSLWGSVSTDDTSCYNRCVGSTSTSSSSDSEEVINQHHKCFDAAFDAYVQGFDFINPFRRSNADCVDTAGLTTIGGHRLNSSFSAWVSSVPRVPRAIALSGAAPLWDLLRAHGYGEKAWLLETYYYRHIMPRHAYIVKQFTGAWAEESAKPTATVSVPRGWKIVSGGVEMSERKGYGQLVTRSYPVTRNDMTARTVAAQRSSGGVGNGGGSGGDHVDDEQTELPSVHDFESTIRTVTNNKTTDQQDTSGIVTWEVQAKDHLHIASGSVRAIAIALWDPTDDYVVSVTRSTSSDAYRPQTTVSTAPSSKGYTVVGGGACVHWVQPGCLLTTSAPTTQGRKAAGWRAAASDHLVSSVGSITAFAVSLKRTDGDEVETISRSGLSDQGVDTYATLSANEEEDSNDDAWWRFVSAGVDVVTAIQGGGGAGGAGAAAAREKAFVIGVGVDENGESVIGQASSYVKEIRHRLRVSGVMLQGAVFVSRAGTAGHIGDDVGAL